MSELSPESFACGACGQQYRWKPELAGKKAKCKCGQTMIVPPSGGRVATAPATGTAASTAAAAGSATAKSSGVAGPAAAAGQPAPSLSAVSSGPVPQATPAPPIAQAAPAPAPAAAPPVPAAPISPATSDAPDEDDMYALAGEDRSTSAAKPAKSATTPAAAPPARAPAPAAAPSTKGDDIDDMYALSEESAPARPAKSPAPARPAPVATAAAAPVAASSAAVAAAPAVPAAGILGYVGTGKQEVQQQAAASGLFRDLYLPIILVVSGILISVLHAVLAQDMPLTYALPMMGILLFVDLALMFLGCMAAIKMMDIAFGDPLQAILKMCAILIGPGAIGTVAAYAVGGGFLGMAVAGAISLVLYYVMFMVFFDLDLTEVMLLSAILIMIRLWLGMLLGGLLVAAILGAEAAPAGIAMGMAGAASVGAPGPGTVGDERPEFSEDKVLRTAEHFAKGSEPEARKWLAENAGNVVAGYQRPGSAKFVEDLYAMGAASVHVSRFYSGERAEAGLVGIMLPSGKKERHQLFAWHKQYAKDRWIRGYLDDNGQPCIVVFMEDATKRADDEASKLDEDPVLLADAAAEQMLVSKRGKSDPTKWTATGEIKLYGISRAKSVQIVRDLQQLGAVQITATGNVADREEGSPIAMNAYTSLVVKLPEQPGSRKALFNWYAEYASRHPGQVFMEDHGQKYIVLEGGPESATPVTPRTIGSTQPSAAGSAEVGDDNGEDEE